MDNELCVEIMDSKRKVKGQSRGTNSRLPFDVNVMLTLANNREIKSHVFAKRQT